MMSPVAAFDPGPRMAHTFHRKRMTRKVLERPGARAGQLRSATNTAIKSSTPRPTAWRVVEQRAGVVPS